MRTNASTQVGHLYATTCTSCGHTHLEYESVERGDTLEQIERSSIYPIDKDQAIEIVIEIVITFCATEYEERNQEPMSEVDKSSLRQQLKDFFYAMKDQKAATWIKMVQDAKEMVVELLAHMPS